MNRIQFKRQSAKNNMNNQENLLLESLGLTAVNSIAKSIRWMFSSDKKKAKKSTDKQQEIRIVSSDEYEKIRRSILSGESMTEEAKELVKKERNNTALFISGLSVAVGFIAINRMKKRAKIKNSSL